MKKKTSFWHWIFPTALILFICSAITLPLILVLTYAGNSETPTHTLELKKNNLVWGSETDVLADGSADLSLFRSHYDNVNSDNGDRVLAPGTAADALIKFINKNEETVTYYAYLYERRSDPDLPVTTKMTSNGSTVVNKYDVPDLLEDETIITVLKGTVTNGTVVDFKIEWDWTFEIDDEHDVTDTYFGDKAAFDTADDVTVGFYIVVEGDDGEITPRPPQTGDSPIKYAVALLGITGVIMIVAAVGRKKERESE